MHACPAEETITVPPAGLFCRILFETLVARPIFWAMGKEYAAKARRPTVAPPAPMRDFFIDNEKILAMKIIPFYSKSS